MATYSNYHQNRGNNIYHMDVYIPKYIEIYLPAEKKSKILDIGCGNGSFLYSLKQRGYTNLLGLDLDQEVVDWVKQNNIPCECRDVMSFFPQEKYDFINISHVLEHLPKEKVILFLSHVKEKLLAENGILFIRVPNAQSNTGCYWAYEDFTHNTLFTAGSLEFVLKCADFKEILFLDIYGISENTRVVKVIKKLLLKIYEMKLTFWNRVTGSFYHKPSKKIYTWELKVIAKNKK